MCILSESKMPLFLSSGEKKNIDMISVGDEIGCYTLSSEKILTFTFKKVLKVKIFKFISTKMNLIYRFENLLLSPLHSLFSESDGITPSFEKFEMDNSKYGKKMVGYSLDFDEKTFLLYESSNEKIFISSD